MKTFERRAFLLGSISSTLLISGCVTVTHRGGPMNQRPQSSTARAAATRQSTERENAAATRFFNENYNIRVVSRRESAIRPFQSRGLLGSSAGSCRDISRSVEITPKTSALPPRPMQIKIRWILKRDYQPLGIREEGDPIRREKTYTISANSNRVSDTIDFNCVPTAMRLHHAALSVLGGIAGASPSESGVNINLRGTDFGFEVVSVGWA